MKNSPIPRPLADLLRLPWPPPWRARGHRRAAGRIPANMAEAMARGEALAWSHSELAGQLWEHGARASRAVDLAKKTVDGLRDPAINSPVAADRQPDRADPGTLKTHEKMNPATISEALASLDPSALLFDLPDSEFVFGGAITDACRAAGFEESGRGVVNSLNAWDKTVAQFAELIATE